MGGIKQMLIFAAGAAALVALDCGHTRLKSGIRYLEFRLILFRRTSPNDVDRVGYWAAP